MKKKKKDHLCLRVRFSSGLNGKNDLTWNSKNVKFTRAYRSCKLKDQVQIESVGYVKGKLGLAMVPKGARKVSSPWQASVDTKYYKQDIILDERLFDFHEKPSRIFYWLVK